MGRGRVPPAHREPGTEHGRGEGARETCAQEAGQHGSHGGRKRSMRRFARMLGPQRWPALVACTAGQCSAGATYASTSSTPKSARSSAEMPDLSQASHRRQTEMTTIALCAGTACARVRKFAVRGSISTATGVKIGKQGTQRRRETVKETHGSYASLCSFGLCLDICRKGTSLKVRCLGGCRALYPPRPPPPVTQADPEPAHTEASQSTPLLFVPEFV